jgi:hypothetical protein
MNPLLRIILITVLMTGLLAACGAPAGTPVATQDLNAVVSTSLAATQQAIALTQANVDASALTPLPPSTPTPLPIVEYSTLTEEELVALIDQTVAGAISATGQTTTAVMTATGDDVVTSDEVATVYNYYYSAEYYTEYADELLIEYYTLYSELAYEMIDELTAIEVELVQMSDTLTEISTTLDEINATLSQGSAAAVEAIDQLEAAAQQAQAHAQEMQTQAQDMMSQLQVDQQGRLDAISQIQPNNIPADRRDALQSAFTFVDAAKTAMGDNKLTRTELMDVAQLGANAQAGFESVGGGGGVGGGPDLSQFTGKFNEITAQFAHGQMPQARGNLDDFERSLGTRPGGGLKP